MSQRISTMAREVFGEQDPSPSWAPCPSGEFERLGKRLRLRRHRRVFLRATTGALAVAAVGGLALSLGPELWLLTGLGGPEFADLTCSETRGLADAFAKGKLDARTREKFLRHLARCEACREFLEPMHLQV